MQLKGRKVFITGAARRLGREMALHLIGMGCDVIVHYNQSASEAQSLQKQCRLFQANFASISIAHLEDRLAKEVGDVDILINNASGFHRRKWSAIDEKLWDLELSVSLKVPFFLSKYYGQQMKARGAGKILNMLDIAAFRPYLSYLPYSIAKAGLAAVTESLARVLAPEVQVNAIAPGTVLFSEDQSEEERKKLLSKIPARRTATIQELLRTVDFLLGDIDYITGQIIILDGGRSL